MLKKHCKIVLAGLLSSILFLCSHAQETDSVKRISIIPERSPFNKDSIKIPVVPVKVPRKDTAASPVKFLKTIKPKGSISIGYDYGVLPFIAGGAFPAGGFRSEGKIGFNIYKIPLEATFFYSSYKNILGLNNYFRINFDAESYKRKMLDQLPDKEKLYKQQLGLLQVKKQNLLQQMAYIDQLKHLHQNYVPALPYNAQNIQNAVGDSLTTVSNSINDSINTLNSSLLAAQSNINQVTNGYATSVNQDYQSYKDSMFAAAYGINNVDSLYGQYAIYKARYDSINQKMSEAEKGIDELKGLQQDPFNNNPYLSKAQQFLGGVKKFEIGLCYPSYSTFLVQNMPVKGVNFEYGKRNNFFAFTYGTTVNNLLFVPSNIQGTLQNVRNLYNYFDFNNLEAGRKIVVVKAGVGSKEKSHLFVGALVGVGRTVYNGSNEVVLLPAITRENNLVLELDAKKVITSNFTVDLIAGKSAVRDGNLTPNLVQENINVIFSDFRSNALLARMNLGIKKSKTNLTFSSRWVDPFFRSFGTGFVRSDNFRFDFKAEQYITSKVKLTAGIKREEDNLLRMYDYKNTLYAFNTSLSVKLNRRLNFRLSYYPIIRNLSYPGGVIQTKNSISNAIVTFTPKCRKGDIQANVVYNYYLVNTDSQRIDFQNIAFINQYQFKNGFKFQVSSSWFRNNLADSFNNNTLLSVIDFGYAFKNNSALSIGGKMANRPGEAVQFGFVARSAIKILKRYMIETSVEKIMPGDFYNGFNMEMINRFPYYCSSRLIINF